MDPVDPEEDPEEEREDGRKSFIVLEEGDGEKMCGEVERKRDLEERGRGSEKAKCLIPTVPLLQCTL